MAFSHGKGAKLLVAEVDLSGYFRGSEVGQAQELAETTVYGKSAKTYIPGLGASSISLDGLFEAAADARLEALLRSASGEPFTWGPEGLALGKRVRTARARASSYASSAPVGGVVTAAVEIMADGELDSGVSLHDLVAEGATAQGGSSDNTASSAAGGAGVLHCTARSGTAPTLDAKVQHSADNVTFVDLVTFAQLTAPGAERKEITGGVNRYLRAAWTISGTGPSFTFTLSFARR